jgi:hypothetical protein
MSNEYNTVLKLGATAPFCRVMALCPNECVAFAHAVSPKLLPALKNALTKGA